MSHRKRQTTEAKRREIEANLDRIEKILADARGYVARNVNVEGSGFLHFDDWQGRSGHPLWMKNFMIPARMRGRSRKERALRDIENKERDKNLTLRKRHKTSRSGGTP